MKGILRMRGDLHNCDLREFLCFVIGYYELKENFILLDIKTNENKRFRN